VNIERLTIVNGDEGDDTIIINGEALEFPVDELLPQPDIWAVQFKDGVGEIEFSDVEKPHESFDDVSMFQTAIDKFIELKIERAANEAKQVDDLESVAAVKASLASQEAEAQEYLD